MVTYTKASPLNAVMSTSCCPFFTISTPDHDPCDETEVYMKLWQQIPLSWLESC